MRQYIMNHIIVMIPRDVARIIGKYLFEHNIIQVHLELKNTVSSNGNEELFINGMLILDREFIGLHELHGHRYKSKISYWISRRDCMPNIIRHHTFDLVHCWAPDKHCKLTIYKLPKNY